MKTSLFAKALAIFSILALACLTLPGCGTPANPDPANPGTQPPTSNAVPEGGIGSDGREVAAAPKADEEPAAAAPAPAPKPALKLGPNVTPDGVVFAFKPDKAYGKIYLAGNFNGWTPNNNDYIMKDDNKDGIYVITVKLAPGTYQYKYVADGNWITDKHSPMTHPDGFGGKNSKFDVK